MMKWLVCLAILACDVSVARACDTAANATAESTCVVLKREGTTGVWFALETANELRKAKLDVPELQLQISTLETKVEARESQLTDFREVVRLKDASLKTSEDNMTSFARRAREAEEARDAWQRSPALWTGIGAVTTAGIAIAAATDQKATGAVVAGAGLATGLVTILFL